MKLRHFPTKRSLKRENTDRKHLVKHLETELRNVRTDLALKEDLVNQYKQENERLWTIIAALTDKYSDNEKQSGFECVGVTECPFD